MWQRIGLKGWILLEIPIIIQSKQFITKQFTHLLKKYLSVKTAESTSKREAGKKEIIKIMK